MSQHTTCPDCDEEMTENHNDAGVCDRCFEVKRVAPKCTWCGEPLPSVVASR